MAYNYKNCHCYNCNVLVLAGEGKWLAWPCHHTLCVSCYQNKRAKDAAIRANKKKAAAKKAYINSQPNLFD